MINKETSLQMPKKLLNVHTTHIGGNLARPKLYPSIKNLKCPITPVLQVYIGLHLHRSSSENDKDAGCI